MAVLPCVSTVSNLKFSINIITLVAIIDKIQS